mmetsp:Transcript_3042/g.4293  ORF Transcript_3042/g.4293 Transcript_3042/m.4293 type:complete len:922 (+) Transcript_3042:715-3480(+)
MTTSLEIVPTSSTLSVDDGLDVESAHEHETIQNDNNNRYSNHQTRQKSIAQDQDHNQAQRSSGSLHNNNNHNISIGHKNPNPSLPSETRTANSSQASTSASEPVPSTVSVKLLSQAPVRNIKSATISIKDTIAVSIVNDPLDNPDNIEVVQQSDTTLPIYEEEVDLHNTSTWSMAPTNLLGTFEDANMNEEQLLLSPDYANDGHIINNAEGKGNGKHNNKTSPVGVEAFSDENPNSGQGAKNSADAASRKQATSITFQHKIEIPRFTMTQELQRNLPQPVVDRCSIYSVIHGVNGEVKDMASQDQNCNTEEPKDEGSALVREVVGPTKSAPRQEVKKKNLAVLDEEKFLLAAIVSRDDDEMMNRACPASFAEATGEIDAMTVNDVGYQGNHSENPLSVVANSRTQLWKPSRSWWEARSGKNPWIEPNLHNKRWRYLWPLIHYHKFLAKCIKKLKRNDVDVKTSNSPVSAFLRVEVCAVSDHLASVSKFSSEQWTDALPEFNGWIDSDIESEERLREIVSTLPMRNLTEPTDVESPILRSSIDVFFLRSMASNREQLSSVQDYGASDSFSAASSSNHRHGNASIDRRHPSVGGANRPPRHGTRGARPGRNMNGRKNFGGKQRRHQMMNGYNAGQSHMMPPSMMQPHGMYDPYHAHNTSQYSQPHPEGDYYYNGWAAPHPMNASVDYNPDGSYHFDQSMDMSYYNINENSFVQPSGTWNQAYAAPMGVQHAEDMSHCSDQASQIVEPEGVSLSFLGPQGGQLPPNVPRQNGVYTPSKNMNQRGSPSSQSPYWGHLTNMMPGLSSPGGGPGGHLPNSPYNHPDANMNGGAGNANYARPLLFNGVAPPTHGVPPSPATQFCSQSNPASQAYWMQQNPMMGYHSSNHVVNTSFTPVEESPSLSKDPSESSSPATTQECSSQGEKTL